MFKLHDTEYRDKNRNGPNALSARYNTQTNAAAVY